MVTQLREATRVARKPHRCDMCHGTIQIGSSHHVSTNLWDGRLYDWRTCTACTEDGICTEAYWWAGYPDEGVGYETAWEWAHEHTSHESLGRAARDFLTRCGCACEQCAPDADREAGER